MKESFDSDNELRRIAPRLSELKKESPFKVPDGYFDSLSRSIQQQVQSLPDFEKTAGKEHFKVPEGYFDSLPTIIQQRIIDEKKKRISWGEVVDGIFFKPKYALALASVAILIVFSIKYFNRTVSVQPVVAEVSFSDLSNSTYLADIDESLLADAVATQITTTDEQKDASLEDYLIENNIDINQLTEHLYFLNPLIN
jgi:hypothetical protein